MAKSLATYWNTLAPENVGRWTPIRGLEGKAEELTLSIDPVTGEYTRLTRFHPGADTTRFGGKSHTYPEEVFVVSGRLHDQAFDLCSKLGITPAVRPVRCMGRLERMWGASYWNCPFPIA